MKNLILMETLKITGMVNILVPTDLSDLSRIAVQYAIRIANKLNGTVTLLHVILQPEPTRVAMRERLKAFEEELVRAAQEDLEALAAGFARQVRFTTPIRCRVAKGSSFNETVKREARKQHSGLIIMGTRGASGLKKVVLGSNTVSIIAGSSIPVIAVPEQATFKGFRNIVYATDMRNLEKELGILVRYIERFGSTIHVLHITSSGRELDGLEERMNEVIHKLGYKNMVSLVLVSRSIDQAIEDYVNVSKADLLAMFTHAPTFYEKIFDRSITRRMAFQSQIPLLAFKQ